MEGRELVSGEIFIVENAIKDPTYAPYCGRCSGLHRMTRVEPFLWKHRCGAIHDSRDTKMVREHLAGKAQA